MLKLADNLNLPVDVVTQTVAILAKRRAGKSYLSRRLVEQLHHARQQVVVIDPKGDHWGVRSSADGKAPGLPIVILGGERGDVPLEAGAGEIVAKLVVEERVSALLDMSFLRKHEVATFMTAFLESLYRLKAREVYRTPLMLVIDEADAVAPQSPMKGEERMLGAAEDIVRRGGQRGIGCTMITQRSAVLNKNVLTQAQILVALRTIAPQDLKAVNAWIDVHGTDEERKTLMASLPSLPVGDAWFWSPGWPTTDGVFRRGHVLPIETYDSGATPKPGEKRREPKSIADVDLDALRRQMAATIEKAKADDPRELKKKLADAQKEITRLQSQPAPKPPMVARKVIERKVITDSQIKILIAAGDKLDHSVEAMRKALDDAQVMAATIHAAAADAHKAANAEMYAPKGKPDVLPLKFRQPKQPTSTTNYATHGFNGNGAPLGNSGKRRILAALAQHLGNSGLTRTKLSILTGISQSGGTWRTYLGELRSSGYVEDLQGGNLRIAEAGLEALGEFDPLPTGAELISYWRQRLGDSGKRRIFDAVVEAYPRALSHDELAEATGIERGGGTFRTYLGELRGLELVEGRGESRAAACLFD
jgi:uncharacterized protein